MVFFRSFYEAIQDYPSKAKAEAVFAIIEYALYGTVPQSTNYCVTSAYSFAKPVIDSTEKRRRRNIENGKKGGAPKGNTNACKANRHTTDTQAKTTEIQPKNNLNKDMDKDKDKNMDMDMEVYMDKETEGSKAEKYKKEPDTAGFEKHTRGEYNNVYLTAMEIAQLINELGYNGYEKSVAFLSRYIKRKPEYKSACHFEDIRSWVQDAVRKADSNQENTNSERAKQRKLYQDLRFEDFSELP